MAEDDVTCDAISSAACYFCLVEAQKCEKCLPIADKGAFGLGTRY